MRFLEEFHRRISRPVLPSDEALEYLPTQAIAAYVAGVMGLDGVIYASTQVGAERNAREQVERTLCNVAFFGDAARIEGAGSEPKPADDPIPRTFVPRIGVAPHVLETTAAPTTAFQHDVTALPPEAQPGLETVVGNGAASGFEASLSAVGPGATLRVEPQPTFVKVTSVRGETSAIFAHLYEDGSVVIRDYENDDD